ncbi:hypothetical protein OROMI_030632 [Orobanche minor]
MDGDRGSRPKGSSDGNVRLVAAAMEVRDRKGAGPKGLLLHFKS